MSEVLRLLEGSFGCHDELFFAGGGSFPSVPLPLGGLKLPVLSRTKRSPLSNGQGSYSHVSLLLTGKLIAYVGPPFYLGSQLVESHHKARSFVRISRSQSRLVKRSS